TRLHRAVGRCVDRKDQRIDADRGKLAERLLARGQRHLGAEEFAAPDDDAELDPPLKRRCHGADSLGKWPSSLAPAAILTKAQALAACNIFAISIAFFLLSRTGSFRLRQCELRLQRKAPVHALLDLVEDDRGDDYQSLDDH